ncbi:hypothetical protein [Chondromyces crocatus]|nr:hypothetical protein [Chondromyces crocatus]
MSSPAVEREWWKGPTWEIQIFYPAPGVLYTRAEGQADLECAQHAMQAFDRVAAATTEKVAVFHDWEGITAYTAEVRSTYTKWSKGHVERLAGVHILIRSRMVAMAVTLVSAAVGGVITAHYDRNAFEKLRAETILRRRRASENPPDDGGPPTSGPYSIRRGWMTNNGQ